MMQLAPPPQETIQGLARLLRAGEISAAQIVENCLARIAAREPVVRAWVNVDAEGAKCRARELDAELKSGRDRGPLHGIPIGIKDIIDVAGVPTGCGSALMAQSIAERDAALVRRLKDAGAIVLGKTVTTQFAGFDPPVTTNPWNPECTPGGSSSGSAAAVAAGMCIAAIGSQTGGSITRPASFCGVAGCKPTYGRVSAEGVFPLAESLDHPGPIARTVRDLAAMLDAISGAEPGDEDSDSPLPPTRTLEAIAAAPLSPPRLGVLRGFFKRRVTAPVWLAFEDALQRFQLAGATLVDVALPPEFDDVLAHHRVLMASEMAVIHERRLAEHPQDYQPRFASMVREGLLMSAPDYARARQHQQRLSRSMDKLLAGIDALACPATVSTAPDRSTTGEPAFNSPWSYTGLPTVSFAVSVAANGLPVALQLAGPRNREEPLFRAAAWSEDQLR